MPSSLLTTYSERLAETLPRVRDQIARAEAVAGRPEGSARLVAVTKSHPFECVEAALAAGLTDLGENRVEELEDKVRHFGADSATWHMIGHLQSRKARRAVAVADWLTAHPRTVGVITLGPPGAEAVLAAQTRLPTDRPIKHLTFDVGR